MWVNLHICNYLLTYANMSMWMHLTKIQSKMKALSSKQHFLHCKSRAKMFVTQGRAAPKPIVWSGPKTNSSEILCLSLLPASLMKIGSKLNWRHLIAWRHHFQQNFHHSRASNSKVNGSIWPKIKLMWDFLPVLVTASCRRSDQNWTS